MLPLMVAFNEAHDFAALIPISVLESDGVDRVLEEIERHLPLAKPVYPTDTLTDRPVSFFAREYIREQVLLQTRSEVPHATAVSIDRFEDSKTLCRISATIHVDKAGQRAILVGKGGERIKELGTQARIEIERLVGKQVHLELFVRISDGWKDMPRQLHELGYDAGSGGRSLASALPKLAERKKKKVPRKAVPESTWQGHARGRVGAKKSTAGRADRSSARRKGADSATGVQAASSKPAATTATAAKSFAKPAAKPQVSATGAHRTKAAHGGSSAASGKPFHASKKAQSRGQSKKTTRKGSGQSRSKP
jgi:hypothetical protein